MTQHSVIWIDVRPTGATYFCWSWEVYLEPGDSWKHPLEMDAYDVRCRNEVGYTHTRCDVDPTEDGYTWTVTKDDRDC
jgi:hypothetical protein